LSELIIRRAFYHEAAVTSLAVALVLSLLFSILGATKLLGRAAGGEHSSEIVLRLLGLELLSSLDVLFPLALFVGLLLTVGRWYRDSEMTALAACGLG
ncbi:MAG: LptF/LptG family permease, partial [Burkholderiales bacterium]|nr:LptF/LptG family permease [Burkholderiales bacterium]